MNKLDEIRKEIEESSVTVSQALEGFVTVTGFTLRDLGKKCSEQWIYKQTHRHADIKYLNFLAVFKLWIAALILSGNVRGFELIINHLELFIRKVKAVALGNRTEFPNMSEAERKSLLEGIIADARKLQWSWI